MWDVKLEKLDGSEIFVIRQRKVRPGPDLHDGKTFKRPDGALGDGDTTAESRA